MKIRLICFLAAAMALAGSASAAAPSVQKKAWITIGDAAFQQAKKVRPSLVSIENRQIRTAGIVEKIHAVALHEAELPAIAAAIHENLRHCGGYVYHSTEAQARAALRRPRVEAPPRAYAIANREIVEPLLARMEEKNIEATIVALSGFTNRYYTSQSGVDASDWLVQHWSSLSKGRTDISVKQFGHAKYPQQSVILTIAGSDNAAESIVVGAHLDSIASFGMSAKTVAPGADDDASGVASMTEALRAMVEQGYKPRRTIHMIAYAAEEMGLRGSQDIARSFKQSDSKVAGVMQLDMTNYKGTATDIYLFTDYTSSHQNEFLAQLIGAYLPNVTIGYDKCGYGCSDHASWDAQGYPTSMPFESSFARDNPYIHSARDTYANSGNQAAHALKFARLAAAFMVELGSDEP
ncbi:MAG TPA: M20/M25/M40 family metallo-hydrolase [Telluria sp.]